MPASKTTTDGSGVAASVRARAEDDARRLDHISASLEAAQKDLAAIGGSLGTGVRDLRRDVNRLLRDARRDLLKMRRAVQRDMEHLQRDLTTAATAKPPASRRPTHTVPKRPARPTSRRPVATAH
jgi:ABC-type transporter Mla subunit MlaD